MVEITHWPSALEFVRTQAAWLIWISMVINVGGMASLLASIRSVGVFFSREDLNVFEINQPVNG